MKYYKSWCSNSELELIDHKVCIHHVKQTGNIFPEIKTVHILGPYSLIPK